MPETYVRDRFNSLAIMSEAHYHECGKLYAEWYKCPACNESQIAKGAHGLVFNFCPMCGMKLVWDEGADKSNA